MHPVPCDARNKDVTEKTYALFPQSLIYLMSRTVTPMPYHRGDGGIAYRIIT
ncbi:hypothetical protein SXCC_01794 [Gluconacetobacter sp. SXCC-1]|nr:hypothetical protein SXCC_01794 [Gluconacetobacter sp. SXCC-1]